MSGTDEQIEIDLGDTPKVETVANEEPIIEIIDEEQLKTEASNEKSPKDIEKALKNLNKKLEKEKLAREDAERRADEARRAAEAATLEASDSNLHLVSGAIDGLRRDQEILKSHLRGAMEIGDFDKAAELQEMMSGNIAKINDLERGFNEMKNQRQQVKPVTPNRPNEVTVDDLINRVTPRSAEWLKQNRDALPDTRSIRIMARAHEDAIDYGITPETDEYFRFVEKRLNIGGRKERSYDNDDDGDDVMSAASNSTQRRSSPPAAPVSRTPAGSNSRPGVVQLTAAEVEAARISGISPQEYYRNKMKEQNRSN
jgi:phage I-like protein